LGSEDHTLDDVTEITRLRRLRKKRHAHSGDEPQNKNHRQDACRQDGITPTVVFPSRFRLCISKEASRLVSRKWRGSLSLLEVWTAVLLILLIRRATGHFGAWATRPACPVLLTHART
jgi:hypothetical protein